MPPSRILTKRWPKVPANLSGSDGRLVAATKLGLHRVIGKWAGEPAVRRLSSRPVARHIHSALCVPLVSEPQAAVPRAASPATHRPGLCHFWTNFARDRIVTCFGQMAYLPMESCTCTGPTGHGVRS